MAKMTGTVIMAGIIGIVLNVMWQQPGGVMGVIIFWVFYFCCIGIKGASSDNSENFKSKSGVKHIDIGGNSKLTAQNINSIKEPIKKEIKKPTDPTDFGYDFLSNEEIHVKFDSLHSKTSNKTFLITELSAWINEQAQKKGKNISYGNLYQKIEKFVENSSN